MQPEKPGNHVLLGRILFHGNHYLDAQKALQAGAARHPDHRPLAGKLKLITDLVEGNSSPKAVSDAPAFL